MSTKQSQAIWELCRQGFQITADRASRSWDRGEPFDPGGLEPRIGRSLEDLIEQCNWELGKRVGED